MYYCVPLLRPCINEVSIHVLQVSFPSHYFLISLSLALFRWPRVSVTVGSFLDALSSCRHLLRGSIASWARARVGALFYRRQIVPTFGFMSRWSLLQLHNSVVVAKSSHGQDVNEWVRLCSGRTSSIGGKLGLACGTRCADPWLRL